MKVLLPISTVFKLAFWLVVIAICCGLLLGHGSGGPAPAGATPPVNRSLPVVVGSWQEDGGKGVCAPCRRMSFSVGA